MLFSDPWFLFVFLPVVLAGAILVRRLAGARAVLGFLVLASVVFYGWWNPIYLPLLGTLAGYNYVVARAIRASRAAGNATRTSTLLTIGIVSNLLALGYFKYMDFFLGTANALLARFQRFLPSLLEVRRHLREKFHHGVMPELVVFPRNRFVQIDERHVFPVRDFLGRPGSHRGMNLPMAQRVPNLRHGGASTQPQSARRRPAPEGRNLVLWRAELGRFAGSQPAAA